MYQIILTENGNFEIKEIEYNSTVIHGIYTTINSNNEVFYSIYCKIDDDVDKYKKKLVNYLLKNAKKEYDNAKKRYNIFKEVKNKISC